MEAEFSFVSFGGDTMALPYVSMSDIAFQVISSDVLSGVFMTKVDGSVIEATEKGFVCIRQSTTSKLDIGNVYYITLPFTSCPDCFRLGLNWKVVGGPPSGLSNIFVRVEDDGYSSKLEYRSTADNFGFTYSDNSFKNAVRLPLYLKESRFSQSRNIYGMLSGRQRILSASVSDEHELETDYMTEEMHRKLIIALMHDEVYVNGRLMTQSSDYSVDWDNYVMDMGVKTAKGKCNMLANTASRSSNCE